MTINNPFFLKEVNVENYAIKLLQETIGLDEIPLNIFDIPEYLDINVEFNYDKFKNNNELGLTEYYSKDTAPKIFINANTFGPSLEEIKDSTLLNRYRFTLAHELAHCYLPDHKDVDIQKSFEDKNNPHHFSYNRQKEQEADRFASCLLIPQETLNKDFINSSGKLLKNAKGVSEIYNTSLQVAIMRLINLNHDNISVVVFVDPKTRKIISYNPSQEFRHYGKGVRVEVKTEVPYSSIANKIANGDLRQDGIPNQIDIKYWFPDFYGQDNVKFTECSIFFSRYIMTYLEITDTNDYELYF